MKIEKGVYRRNRRHLLKTEESQTPDVKTNDVPMEIESDTAPVITTPDTSEAQPVEMPVTTSTRLVGAIREPERFKDHIKYKSLSKLLKDFY